MTTVFADTSALIRAYVPDEPPHDAVRAILLDGANAVVASALARVEFAAAAHAAERAGRIPARHALLHRFDVDCGRDGPVALVAFDPDVMTAAYDLVRDHPIRTLDALHLAVLIVQVEPIFGGVALVTCDATQSAVADSLGIPIVSTG